MKRPSIVVATLLVSVLTASDTAVAAAGANIESTLPPAVTPDPASWVGPGTSLAGAGGGPVLVDLALVPTGDPRRVPGVLRGHDQGRYEGAGQPDLVLGSPLADPGAVFGDSPTPLGERGAGEAPLAPGDWRRNFDGQTTSGWIPPDPVLAAGPRYLLEVVNSGFTVFSKDGGLERAYTDLQTFFTPILDVIPCAAVDCFVFDPRVLYSHYWNKFVMAALVRDDTNNRSYIVFAISASNDPLGAWWQYYTYDVSSTADAWTDYSGMSADPWGVYFTGNNWLYAGGFKYAIIISIRPDVFSGAWNGAWDFWDLRWNETGNPQAFDVQPAVDPLLFPADEATFFVNTFNSSGDKACIWKLTGDRGSDPTLLRGSATVSPYADPGLAHQPAPGLDDIEMFYAGSQNVSYSQRHVYLALNDAGAGNSGFYVSKINVDSFTEARNITYYTGNDYYYYPNSILFGDSTNPLVAVAMSRSSDSVYASGLVKTFVNFTVDNTGPFWIMAGGSGTYNVYFQGRNRWGDYMGIARDPVCDTAWQVTEYAPSTDVWRTRISEVLGTTSQTGICNLIFDDGFERGSSANWSLTQP